MICISLGLYDGAYQLMIYPLQLVIFAFVLAIQPNVVELQSKEEIVKIHNWIIEVLAFIYIFICFFLATSGAVLCLFFGGEWESSSAIFFIFCFMIPLQILMSSSGGFFQSCNAVNVSFWSGAVSATLNVLAIFIGIYLGDYKRRNSLVITKVLNKLDTNIFLLISLYF